MAYSENKDHECNENRWLLQATIGPTVQRVYVDLGLPYYTGSFKINETTCPRQETIPDVYAENALPPCSIDNQTSPWTLWQAPTAYRVLAAGLLNQTGDYNKEDFNALWNASDSGTFDFTQLVTHIDRVTRDQHVHYFDPMSAQEDSYSQKPRKTDIVSGDYDRLGLDYIANTTSIVTKCRPVTQECGLRSSTEDDSSVPYHCSDSLNGDLNEIPANGLERLKGWNTTFYDGNSGDPRSVSIASQLNPFSYNVTVIVDSINIGGLEHFNDPQVPKGIVVGVSDGRVGFALSCTSTVYDVTYSLVDGNVYAFNTTRAEPRTAAIVKAPLQAGFGSYALYEKAAMSVLLTNLTVMDAMELAFSQTFLALAAGVYSPAPNLEERYRYDLELTKIAKASSGGAMWENGRLD
ncbi:hypothetical protein J4E91_004477 [Alternaria rosae]|nr:hypothetical protein J4E91_004477 [Alternaria rosae]